MDLNTVTEVRHPANADAITKWEKGYAWLAGGTWLFSEPQIDTHTLIDLDSLKWPSLRPSKDGLEIAATCKIVELDQFVGRGAVRMDGRPPLSRMLPFFPVVFQDLERGHGRRKHLHVASGRADDLAYGGARGCVRALAAGWKATGSSSDRFRHGQSRRISSHPANSCAASACPASALKKAYAFRRFTLTHLGRSEVLIIGTTDPGKGDFLLTVTAATVRPMQLSFNDIPDADGLKRAIDDAVPFSLYLDDVHGSPAHRKHLTYYFAEQIRQELSSQNRGHA